MKHVAPRRLATSSEVVGTSIQGTPDVVVGKIDTMKDMLQPMSDGGNVLAGPLIADLVEFDEDVRPAATGHASTRGAYLAGLDVPIMVLGTIPPRRDPVDGFIEVQHGRKLHFVHFSTKETVSEVMGGIHDPLGGTGQNEASREPRILQREPCFC